MIETASFTDRSSNSERNKREEVQKIEIKKF